MKFPFNKLPFNNIFSLTKYFWELNQIRTKCIQFYSTKFSIIRISFYALRLKRLIVPNMEMSLYIFSYYTVFALYRWKRYTERTWQSQLHDVRFDSVDANIILDSYINIIYCSEACSGILDWGVVLNKISLNLVIYYIKFSSNFSIFFSRKPICTYYNQLRTMVQKLIARNQ